MTSSKTILPMKTIGIIGGGQLGKMLAQSALRMGYKVAILDPSEDAPARATCHEFIHADFSDESALKQLAEMSDVLTYEFENIDAHLLRDLVEHHYVPQGAETVLTLQDRETEKAAIQKSGATVVPYQTTNTKEELQQFIETHDYPVIVKTATGGYDGKGQYLIESEEDIKDVPFGDVELVTEKYIDLEREVSLTVARSASGETVVFPLQENLHRNQILYRTIAPSRIDVFEEAKRQVELIMEELLFVGVFTVEFFVDKDNNVYVNEIAPRPHNSAHYTIEACNISQFDAHILAVCDLPLPEVYQHQPAIMMNLLGQDLDRLEDELYKHSDWNVHLYGKSDRKPERKMGHVTILTDEIETTLNDIKQHF